MVKKEPEGLTLTKVTRYGRKFVKYGVITLVVLMVGRVTLSAFAAYWRAANPPKPPEPTAGFGQLPPIAFPVQTAADKPASYTLETASGGYPEFGDRAKVFLKLKGSPSLLDADNAAKVAARYGFTQMPETLTAQVSRWTKNQPLNTTFDMDIINYNFEYETDFLNRPELILNIDLPTDFDAVQQVRTFLNTADLLPDDIATSSGKVTYLKAVGGALRPAVSVSDADYVQVDINRSPIDGMYELYTSDPNQAVIHAILLGSRSGNSVLRLIRQYFSVDYAQMHTYYLRSPQSAWQQLQSGEGYIANKGTAEPAVIRSIALGYYDSYEYEEYLQPIYVFMGDGDFIGYVSALDQRYILQPGVER